VEVGLALALGAWGSLTGTVALALFARMWVRRRGMRAGYERALHELDDEDCETAG
jgi:hypothetical protein